MKKRYLYSMLLLLFVAISAFVIIGSDKKQNSKTASLELLPRNPSLAYTIEWSIVKNNAAVLQAKLKVNPADIKSLLGLAALFINEARVTGNLNFYNEASLNLIEKVLEQEPKNFEALTFKATILLSQHRFEQAREIAEQVKQLYPQNAYMYGLIVDASVELGNYTQALDAAEKMISIRPDNRSYSRIAYLREIHGDIEGAIEAMTLAVDAGAPGDENTEWCRVQMGKLYEQIGKTKEALMQYSTATTNRENYPYALAGLARLAVQEKNYIKALALYNQANDLIPDHTFKEGIAECYKRMGQPGKAKTIAEDILAQLKKLNAGNKNSSGQNEDHEMAHAYMGVEDFDRALDYAIAEYNRRPANIEVNETLALVYFGKGDYANAKKHIEIALSTGCKNPELLCHAGMIFHKVGNSSKAKKLLETALMNNPIISADLKVEAEEILKSK